MTFTARSVSRAIWRANVSAVKTLTVTVATSARSISTTSQPVRVVTVTQLVLPVHSRDVEVFLQVNSASVRNAWRVESAISARNSTGIFNLTTLMDAKVLTFLLIKKSYFRNIQFKT